MSRAWVWIATGLSAAFLAGTAVLLGARLAAGPQRSPDYDAVRSAQLRSAGAPQGVHEELRRLRSLVATYRQREAVYRQRLDEANRLLRSSDRQQGSWDRNGLRYRSGEHEEREEDVNRWKRGDRKAHEREEHEREEYEGREHEDED